MASQSSAVPIQTDTNFKNGAVQDSRSSGSSKEFIAKNLKIKRVTSSNTRNAAGPSPKRKSAKISQVAMEVYKKQRSNNAKQSAQGEIEIKPKRSKKEQGAETEEKRIRKFRAKAPTSYTQRLERVLTQRMFLLDRNRRSSQDGSHEEEVFDICGTTGNIYQVTITRNSTCTCPDAAKGNQCKHIIYVLVNVLKARSDLAYQLALLTTELTEIFANAPSTPQSSSDGDEPASTNTGGLRKPIEGDCPICVMEFEVSNTSELIIWCKGACGNNVHKHCFEQWAKSKPGEVKCVYCRTPWKAEEPSDEIIKNIDKTGKRNFEGYVNVGSALGLSGERDMSTYHPYWVSGQRSSRG